MKYAERMNYDLLKPMPSFEPTEGARRYWWPNPEAYSGMEPKCEAYRAGQWVEIPWDGKSHDDSPVPGTDAK